MRVPQVRGANLGVFADVGKNVSGAGYGCQGCSLEDLHSILTTHHASQNQDSPNSLPVSYWYR